MFHPVGPEPPSVYWRRRLVMLGSVLALLVLLVLTVKIAVSGGDDKAAAGATTSAASTPASNPAPPPTTSAHRATHASATAKNSARTGRTSGTTSSAPPPPARCTPSALAVTAVVGSSSYKVGQQPVLELQVTNTGSKPCVQDLADKQVELRVYNGESRVWGSHDCKLQPGVADRTLAPGMPVRVAITWSGLTSQPNCAGTRQRVGAGTYTLYAALSGKTGKAAQFTIS